MINYAKRHILNILGCIANDLDLIRGDKYILNEDDFMEGVYSVIFTGLQDISIKNYNLKSIKPMDLDNYISQYDDSYRIFKLGKGLEFLMNGVRESNIELFDLNYNMLRKFSLLKKYKDKDISISQFIDENEENFKKRAEQIKILESIDEEAINNTILLNVMNIRESWTISNSINQKSYKAGDNIDENSEAIGEGGEIGFNFPNRHLNAHFLGMPKGELFLYSAGTNGGKTRAFIEMACHFSCSHIYNINTRQWEENPNPCIPTLYTVTELDLKEVQIIMRATLAGVSTGMILKGNYSPEIKARLDRANEIIKEAPLYIEEIEDFEIMEYKALLEKHIIRHQVEVVIHDYIELTGRLSKSVAETFGIQAREDLILQNFAQMLKTMAKDYNVAMVSGTQLNSDMTKGYYESRLAGGVATARKATMGLIGDSVRPDELAKLTKVLEGLGEAYTPNYCYHIYKNRRGGRYINVYVKRDLGKMRDVYCFTTNYDHELMDDIEEAIFRFEGEKQAIENMDYTPIDQQEDGVIDF